MSKTILLCSNIYPPHIVGGAEVIAHTQAKTLQKLGCRVAVFAGEGQVPGTHYGVSRDFFEGITVYRVYLNAQDYSTDFVNFFHKQVDAKFSRVLDEVRPDVIHMHNLIGLSVGLVGLAARRGIHTVLTLHDYWGFCLKSTLIKIGNEVCHDFSQCVQCQPYIADSGDRNLPIRLRSDSVDLHLSKVDAFVSPSRYLASVYAKAGFPQDRLHVISNGIDVGRFSGIKKNPRSGGRVRFTYIGYLGEHKGIQTLLEALPLIDSQNLQLNIVGDGHLRPTLERRVAELDVRFPVRFWGKVKHSEIEEVFRDTDVQVMPSVYPENQPVSITESMATQTPVIASNIGGNPELVLDGETGYLFAPASSVQLAERMSHFLSEPARIERFGKRAFERIHECTLERQVGALLELYDEVATAPRRVANGDVPLIACFGDRFNDRSFRATARMTKRFGRTAHRFVSMDWLSGDDLKDARVIWVVTDSRRSEIQELLKYGLPLLVPGDVPQLKALVLEAACGLYYETEEEAVECLLWLIENEAERKELASNARDYRPSGPGSGTRAAYGRRAIRP